MNRQKQIVTRVGFIGLVLLGGCVHEPTALEDNFGSSVRNMIEAQTFDPSTLSSPSTETLDGGDGQRTEAVLERYRSDIARPEAVSEDIVVSVEGGR
jgi:hypothetical protein